MSDMETVPLGTSARLAALENRMKLLEDSFPELKKVAPMRRGTTEAETLTLNGWGIGTILEGKDLCGKLDRIVITAIGESEFLCRWDHGVKGVFQKESGNTTLTLREWREIKKDGNTA